MNKKNVKYLIRTFNGNTQLTASTMKEAINKQMELLQKKNNTGSVHIIKAESVLKKKGFLKR